MSLTDAEKIALAVALVVILAAAAFALSILYRRLAARPSLLQIANPIGPIGFVHF